MATSTATLLIRYNPWLVEPNRQVELISNRLPSPFIPRHHETPLNSKHVLLVVGPRQAGKSTLLLNLAMKTGRPLVIVNAEEPAFRGLCGSPAGFLEWLDREVIDCPALLVFEEIQHLREAGLFLKGLIDLGSEHLIAATGSASFHLLAQTRESLAGRAVRVTLLPFSHAELLAAEDTPTRIAETKVMRQLWHRQLRYGSYPEVWLSSEPEAELARLVEAFVIRDASDLFRVENLDAFRTILRQVGADTGNLVNLSAWAAEAGVTRDTASRYLTMMEETHLIRRVRPFLGGKRAEIKAAIKPYYLDCGLRNAVFGGFRAPEDRADGGALAETFVFGELAKHIGLLDSIRYWRTRNGAEVDFVLDLGSRRIGIEVKLGALKQPKVTRGAREFIKAYQPDRLIVVNASLRAEKTLEGTTVEFCQPWEIARIVGSNQPC